jgi:predicted nucleic acid-binding protein
VRRSKTTAPSAEQRLVYADSSALVKLVIDEPESPALERHLAGTRMLATSRIALVEVARATRLANPAPEVADDTSLLLASCMLVDVTDDLLRFSARLSAGSVRTLDAIHLASALRIEADELVGYDRRLATAAAARGLSVASPGAALADS